MTAKKGTKPPRNKIIELNTFRSCYSTKSPL